MATAQIAGLIKCKQILSINYAMKLLDVLNHTTLTTETKS